MSIVLTSKEAVRIESVCGKQIRELMAGLVSQNAINVINGGELAGVAFTTGVDLDHARALAWRVVREQEAAQPVSD